MNAMHSLFAQKTWAKNELFNVLAIATAEAHAEALHSAIRTFNHVHLVDRTFNLTCLECTTGFQRRTRTPHRDWMNFSSRWPSPRHGAQHREAGKKWVRAAGCKTGPGAPRQALWREFAAHSAHDDENFNRKPKPF